MARVRVNESKSEWVPKQAAVDLGALGLTDLMDEFEANQQKLKVLAARQDVIKEHMKRFGTDFVIEVNGEQKWRVRSDGAFMPKQFKLQYPGFYEDCMIQVTEKKFSVDVVKEKLPALYSQFRAQRLEKIEN